ncbi:MAG TPA: ABC transporter ATP-binding protein [Anaerolineales bacterium]|nr:ABC transporter ATP-binding protein [Anaerolineales bacterium]
MISASAEALVRVDDVKLHFPIQAGVLRRVVGHVRAVDGVSFEILQRETLGLVGESGCGKTTLGRAILHLYRPTAGRIEFEGQDLAALSSEDLRRTRRRMQVVFQDPFSSLNPRMTIGAALKEPLEVHGLHPDGGEKAFIARLLERVGLKASFADRYPHEFSGGQRQRIGIARALTLTPSFIVADEPITSLDVSIQAQVVNLLQDLQAEYGLTYLFITHDLSMVRYLCDRVAVMYLGRVVEMAPVEELYTRPAHPYSQALLSAIPVPDPAVEVRRRRIILTGDVPNPAQPPPGCAFHTRCPVAEERCRSESPRPQEVSQGHSVSCFLVQP